MPFLSVVYANAKNKSSIVTTKSNFVAITAVYFPNLTIKCQTIFNLAKGDIAYLSIL